MEQLTTSGAHGVEVGDVIKIATYSRPTFCWKGWGVWLQLPVYLLQNHLWAVLVRTFYYRRIPWVPNWVVDVSVFVNRYLHGRLHLRWPLRIRRYDPYDGVYTVSSVEDSQTMMVTPYGDVRS